MFAFNVPKSEAFFISDWDNSRGIRIEFKPLLFLPASVSRRQVTAGSKEAQ